MKLLHLLVCLALALNLASLGHSNTIWTHYVYLYWPEERDFNDTLFNETVIDEWRQSHFKSVQNHNIYYNTHNTYSDMIRIVKEPHLFGYARTEPPEMLFHSTLSILDAWIKKGIYFEPAINGRARRNETLLLETLIRHFRYIQVSIPNQASFSLYDSIEELHKNRWYVSLQKDLLALRELFVEHAVVHTKVNISFAHQQVTVRLHDILMRIFATNVYNDWFKETMPSFVDDYITMRRGYIPHRLFPPVMMERLMCEIQKAMQPYFEMWRDCADFYHYYSIRMISVARAHNQLLVRFQIPVDQRNVMLINKNESSGNTVVDTVAIVPVQPKHVAWYSVAEAFFSVSYTMYTLACYVLAFAWLVNLLRDPAWANIFPAYILLLQQHRVDAVSVTDVADTVAAASNRPIIDLVYQFVFLMTILSVIVFTWMRKVIMTSHRGYEMDLMPQLGILSQYKVVVKLVLDVNSVLARHYQEVTIMTRLMSRVLHSDTNRLQLIGRMFTFSVVQKYGQKYFRPLSPLYIDGLDAGGLVVMRFHYFMDIPLTDIRWDAYGCPRGLTNTRSFGTAYIHLIREVEAIYQNVGHYCTPKRRPRALEANEESEETRL